MRGGVKSLVMVVGVNLALLLVAAVIIEVIFGRWFTSDPIDQLSVPRDQQVKVTAAGLYPGGEAFVYRRDHWGFRGGGVDPATIEILTLGGSTTNQLYLTEDSTWQAVAARALRAAGRPVVIGNAGIDGQSSVGTLTNLRAWLPHVPGLKPRLILVYTGINDTAVGGNVVDELKYSSIHKSIRQKSALMRFGATVSGILQAQKAKLNHQAIDFSAAQWSGTPNGYDWAKAGLEPGTGPYRERLTAIVRHIQTLGSRPVLVTQRRGDYRTVNGNVVGLVMPPDGPNGMDQYLALSRFNAATLEVCRETGATCLDLGGELDLGDGDFYDMVHTTPQGAEKIGRWLAGRLGALL